MGGDRRQGAAPARFVALALDALPRETDEQNVQRILAYARQAYWNFLSASEREHVAPRLEQTLKAGLASAPTPSLKSAWFSTLRDVAVSDDAGAFLERVWRKSEQVPGLTLAEPDYITLALELAVRERPRWREILDEQLTRIENPDRKDRFAYVRPALSADQGVRDTFFERLKQPSFRQREAWVLEGLNYLHHPLRASTSESTFPTVSPCCARFSAPATSSFPSGGWMRRWVATAPRRRREWLRAFSRSCHRTIPIASAASSCRRRTTCSARVASDGDREPARYALFLRALRRRT